MVDTYDHYWEKYDDESEEDGEEGGGKVGDVGSVFDSMDDPLYASYSSHTLGSKSKKWNNNPNGVRQDVYYPSPADLPLGSSPVPPPMWLTLPNEEKSKCCFIKLRNGVLSLGISGICLGVSGLIAYSIIQIPEIRHQIGYFSISTPGSGTLFTYDNEDDTLSPDELIYGTELTFTIIMTILGIIVNSLLVYGVVTESGPFILPWLIFNVFFILGIFISAALIFVLLSPHLYKIYGIIPIAVGLFGLYLWIKVWEYYQELNYRRRMNMATIEQMYRQKYLNYSRTRW